MAIQVPGFTDAHAAEKTATKEHAETHVVDSHVSKDSHGYDGHASVQWCATHHATEEGAAHVLGIVPDCPIHHNGYITNTVITTWIFMLVVLVFGILFKRGATKKKGFFYMFGFHLVKMLDGFFGGIIHNKKFQRQSLFLLGSLIIFIAGANLFSLFMEWILSFYPAYKYIRPISADINTTVALAVTTIVLSHIVMIRFRGVFGYISGYLFNFSGNTLVEKVVNVFIGWIHLIGEGVRITSLSLRLFGNIFGGAILLGILIWLTGKVSIGSLPIGNLLTIPFWLFEMFVACVQALIFCTLSAVYFDEATHAHH